MALNGHNATIHQIVVGDGPPRGSLLALAAARMVLATGSLQRLPVFPGNRLPFVSTAIGAYHLAKRYGVVHGASAVIATQSNYGYRVALRLHDAGVAIRRVIDIRINPQSRFIDFAKASGLTIASGQFPSLAQPGRFAFANIGSVAAAATIEADQLIVGGPWQPDLALWMQAGGAVRWNNYRSVLEAGRPLEHIELVGSAAGYRSMLACAQSGREAVAALFGQDSGPIEDIELGTFLETPDASFPVAPPVAGAPSFLSSGQSLAHQAADARLGNLSLGDVAASVELGVIAPADAGAIAEERGAPGPDLVASPWTPPPSPDAPAYLAHRFGEAPERLHLVVDDRRGFEVGALIYATGVAPEPVAAIGVIVETATPGGIALVSRTAAAEGRFVIETDAGPFPARVRAPLA
jgi:sarcosine oxidase subunit alpha